MTVAGSTPSSGGARSITATAFAKLTLSLRVRGLRPDGFHELEALTVSVGAPVDQLRLVEAPTHSEPAVSVSGPYATGVPVDDTNLAVRALRAACDAAGSTVGCSVHLHKGIAPAAGLGGGSADAAAALLAARALLALPLSDANLATLGATLGSDVPFCLGSGPAWMRGRGEVIEPVDVGIDLAVVIAVPPFGCSTPAVYRAWDELGGPAAARRVPMPGSAAEVIAELRNDLEPAAERVQPRLADFRTAVEAATGVSAVLAGSGAAYALVCEHLDDAERHQRELRGAGIEAHLGGVVAGGVELTR